MTHDQLGPYKVIRKLGEGAMGAVYEGVHEQTGQRAALKLLAPALAEKAGFRARFEAEIESLRRLKHPNIVEIYGFGAQDNLLFYAMECVDGVNLDEPLQQGQRYDWRQVVEMGVQICHALKHAHDRGIIHRDLKPANLMITADKQIKLADFGIAHLYGVSGMTVAGGPIGTASYMSPEQTVGEKVTERSDLYSLGCVLYTLLSGRGPFVTQSLQTMLEMHRTREPEPVSVHVADVPEELDLIIKRLLQKKPEDRLPTAATAARSLSAVIDAVNLRGSRTQPGISPPPQRPTSTSSPSSARTGATDQTQLADQPPLPAQTAMPISRSRAAVNFDATLDHAPPESETYELADQTLASEGPTHRSTPSVAGSARNLDADADDEHDPDEDHDSGSVFITAEEAAAHDREIAEAEARDHPRIISTTTVVMIVIVLVVSGLSIYFLRPASADKLANNITRFIDEGSDESIEKADQQIRELRRLYPNDPRLTEMAKIEEQADLLRQERRLERRAKWNINRQESSTIESSYLDAISYAQTKPELALAKLKALYKLYNEITVIKSEQVFTMLKLTQRQIERLELQINDYADEHIKLLEDRIKRAGDLMTTDPQAAGVICHSVIELYADKPWADKQVAQARQMLEQLPPEK